MENESGANNQSTGQSTAQQEKTDNLKKQVESVKAIMVENVERILERGERLDDIERRTEHLQNTSSNFKLTARKVQRKFCMLNAKWTVILTLVILIVFVVLLILILHWCGVIGGKKKND